MAIYSLLGKDGRRVAVFALSCVLGGALFACAPATIAEEEPDNEITIEAAPAVGTADSGQIASPAPEETFLLDGIPDPQDELPPEIMSHQEDYVRYKSINSDVIGWISVPNTRIEYPVVIGEDNDYYLGRNVEKERSKSGSIYMDYRNANPDQQRHIVLYGHNMRNGTMFQNLNYYKKKDFFDNNRTIYLYWNDKPVEYEIYAAFNVGIDTDFIKTKFDGDEEFLADMNTLKSLSKYSPSPDVELKASDQVLTLSTCTYEYDDQRFVVQARRVTP